MTDETGEAPFTLLSDFPKALRDGAAVLGAVAVVTGYFYTTRYLSHFGLTSFLWGLGSLQYALRALWPIAWTALQFIVALVVYQLDLWIGSKRPRAKGWFAFDIMIALGLVAYMIHIGCLPLSSYHRFLPGGIVPWIAAGLILTVGNTEAFKFLRYVLVTAACILGVLFTVYGLADFEADRDLSFERSTLMRVVLYSGNGVRQIGRLITYDHGWFYLFDIAKMEHDQVLTVVGIPETSVTGIELKPPVKYAPPPNVGVPVLPTPTPQL